MRINRMQILILVISLSNLPARCAQLILSNMAELAEVTVTTLLYRIRVIVRECLASLPRVSAENLPTIIAAMLYFPVNVNVNPDRTTSVLFIAKGDQLGITSSLTGQKETMLHTENVIMQKIRICNDTTEKYRIYADVIINKSSDSTPRNQHGQISIRQRCAG